MAPADGFVSSQTNDSVKEVCDTKALRSILEMLNTISAGLMPSLFHVLLGYVKFILLLKCYNSKAIFYLFCPMCWILFIRLNHWCLKQIKTKINVTIDFLHVLSKKTVREVQKQVRYNIIIEIGFSMTTRNKINVLCFFMFSQNVRIKSICRYTGSHKDIRSVFLISIPIIKYPELEI